MSALCARQGGVEEGAMIGADTNAAAKQSLTARLLDLYKRHQTLVKYFLIGGTASAIDVILFLVLFNLVGTSALAAHSISVPTSVIFSFTVNARHNFYTTDHIPLRLASFVIVAVIGYLVGLGVIAAAAAFGLGENAGKILSLPLVFVVQYVLNSRITFYKSRARAADNPARSS
ncbi:MAG: GtrA family protein [Caulobacterales bacterium]|nr:GtrA family protein [Caulobacterales bacterium]